VVLHVVILTKAFKWHSNHRHSKYNTYISLVPAKLNSVEGAGDRGTSDCVIMVIYKSLNHDFLAKKQLKY
jgi:hypothetical protein